MRRSFKGALVVLVFGLLALLLWQLQLEFRQLKHNQRELNLAVSEQLARQLGMSMASLANAGQALLGATQVPENAPDRHRRYLDNLLAVFPSLQSIARLDANGRVLHDSAPQSGDQRLLAELAGRSANRRYQYAFTPGHGGRIYLLLHSPVENGYWALRLNAEALAGWMPDSREGDVPWLLEDASSERVIAGSRGLGSHQRNYPMVTAANQAQTVSVQGVPGSDWQLRTLLDERQVQTEVLPEMAGKFLLFILCSLLTLFALYRLLREQSNLHALNAASRRSLYLAASALGVIEERVLVTDSSGRLTYLNPQAEALFGLANRHAREWHLLELLPRLDPLLLHATAFHSDLGPDLVEITQDGDRRLFTITRSDLGDDARHLGFVWVLRDVTEEQHATRVLQETRRRYQDIFDGTGTALCVLDLAGLHQFLVDEGLSTGAQLQPWLQSNPQRHSELLRHMRITETNQVALRLLGVSTPEQAWQQLINRGQISPGGFRSQLSTALLAGGGQLELESHIDGPNGIIRHLWLVMRLPESLQDLHAVALSISDITSRKRMELSLVERERFWSEVVRAVPDTLYVNDIPSRTLLFSNHDIGTKLGYDAAFVKDQGDDFWKTVVHPDDSDLHTRVRNLQTVLSDGVLLESQFRARHQNGSWRWFSVTEQALSRDANGWVGRLIGVAKDITEQIARNESLRDNEQRYRMLAESISDVICSTDSQLTLNYISPSVQTVLGYTPQWIQAHGFEGLATNPQQLTGIFALVERIRSALGAPQQLHELRQTLTPQLFVFDCLHGDGRKIPVELRLVPMWDDNGRFEGLLGVGRDIGQQRRAEKDLRMAATVFEHSTAAILVTDLAGYIVQVNNAFSRVSGYSSEQVLDQLPGMLTADSQQSTHLHYVLSQLYQRGTWEGEIWLKRRNGENFPAWVGITAVHDEEGDLVSYVCFFSDISERKASEQRIHRLAYYDALTQLPNRTLFQDRLHTALQHAERHREWVALMFLDLDRFKPINDSLGHAAGDRMLKDVAVRLAACVGEDDTVARMGGDEFTLLLQSNGSREGALHRAIHVAEQILASLARAFVLEGREFFVTASIGIALSPQDGNELSQLMKNADTAMYHAKERGKNNFQFYQADMNASALERLELESDLRHALEQGEFLLHYQPQFSGNGKRLTGVEALLRWQHPKRGLVAPDAFIPVLEELGLVVQVGDWVLAEACRQLNIWHHNKIRVPKVSVNLSARQFSDGQLHRRIERILGHSNIPAACLELELTESILMQDVGAAMQTLKDLKSLGLCIAIDDFGTGYSSLNYLKQFPIDVLKIDRSFVDGLPQGEQDGQIARAIIAMAHSLNMTVIAEGVETQDQLDFLRNHECDEVQGYLLGRPMPAHQFEAQFCGRSLFMLE
ncbi:bifunctional diguanylate cyclase/phosphodiesterase [Phytopseudomonas flavescens]|nr:EAL domain-containing protein [Pseudomonas flavescens]